LIGLDTNVLVRYLAQDDPAQSARATRLIERELSEGEPGYISLVVLVETCWVLKRLYGATPAEIASTVRDLLGVHKLVVESRGAVARANDHAGAGDLADALIAELAREAGCKKVVTFDRRAVKVGMVALL
jgi:predicted nucleic-acid-binding protein